MDNERKSRKKTPDVDFSRPINISLFGTDKDPCFGKLNDATHPACKQCGDCELCFIVQSQNLHLKRNRIEKKNAFIDKEMPDAPKALDRDKFDEGLIEYLKGYKDKFKDFRKVSILMGEKFDLMGGEATVEVKKAIKRIKASKSKTKVVYNKAHTKIKAK